MVRQPSWWQQGTVAREGAQVGEIIPTKHRPPHVQFRERELGPRSRPGPQTTATTLLLLTPSDPAPLHSVPAVADWPPVRPAVATVGRIAKNRHLNSKGCAGPAFLHEVSVSAWASPYCRSGFPPTAVAGSFPVRTETASGTFTPTLEFFLDEAEHFFQHRMASVAALRGCSGSSRNAVRLPFGKTVRSAVEEESRSEERGEGKGRHVLSPPQHTVTRSATSAPVEPSSPGVRPSH